MADRKDEAPRPVGLPETEEDFNNLVNRARQGDAETLPALRLLMSGAPDEAVRACGGDLVWNAEKVAVKRMAGKNLAVQEALHRKLELLRAELAGPHPSPIERLLAERAALCWLDCHDWEIRHNGAMAQSVGLTTGPGEHDHYQRMRDRSQRRYLHALKTLATVRKLSATIQINVAKSQVNLAEGGA